MNEHTKRIIGRVQLSLNAYLKGEIDERELSLNIEGNSNALEEANISRTLNRFLISIEDSLHLYDVQEGKLFLANKIEELKSFLNELLISEQSPPPSG